MMGSQGRHNRVGRNVAFVGGPEAGNVRVVPEDVTSVTSADDWVYRIHPIKFHGAAKPIWFAYNADIHPAQLIVDMWESYSATEQLRQKVC